MGINFEYNIIKEGYYPQGKGEAEIIIYPL